MSEEQQKGDFVISLSSDLIATVMEKYFNDVMFKKIVEVVDLSPITDGYAFTLGFVTEAEKDYLVKEELSNADTIMQETLKRLQRREDILDQKLMSLPNVVIPNYNKEETIYSEEVTPQFQEMEVQDIVATINPQRKRNTEGKFVK